MAIFDAELQRIVVRVVYDGPAMAGKTTNVEQLCTFFSAQRRSELFVPRRRGDRTLFFDWMHLDGGLVDGRSLRCQFATVPGQNLLAHRRQAILKTADVVVFVCDSDPHSLEDARLMLEDSTRLLAESERGMRPLIVQANKQDLEGALPVEQVRARLRLADEVPMTKAVASEGSGVRETAVLAVRAAANHVQRELLDNGIEGISGTAVGPEAFFRQLLALEEDASATLDDDGDVESLAEDNPSGGADAAVPESTVPTRESVVVDKSTSRWVPDTTVALPLGSVAQRTDARTPFAKRIFGPLWTNLQGRVRAAFPVLPWEIDTPQPSKLVVASPELPSADVPSGYIWPALDGRAALAAIDLGAAQRMVTPPAGARDADGDWTVYRAGARLLWTSKERQLETVEDGKAALFQLVRKKCRLRDLLPDGTVVTLQPTEDGTCWLWTITPRVRSLQDDLDAAVAGNDSSGISRALVWFARAVLETLRVAGRDGLRLRTRPAVFGVQAARVVYLSETLAVAPATKLGAAILAPVETYAGWPEAVEHYVATLSTGLGEAPLQGSAAAEVRAAVLGSQPRTTVGLAARGRLATALTQDQVGP